MGVHATICSVYNKTPHKSIGDRIPHEILHGQPCTVKYFKRFGCLSYILNQAITSKFEPRALEGFLVGCCDTHYLIIQPKTGKVFKSKDVRCIELKTYGDVYNKQEKITVPTDPPISPSEEGADFFKTESENISEPRKKEIKNVGDARDAFALLCDKWIVSCNENEKYNRYDDYEELEAYLIRNEEEPQSYTEAVNSDSRVNWLKAIKTRVRRAREKRYVGVEKAR